MSAPVRRLLLAALLVGFLVTLGAAPTQAACACATPADPLLQRIKTADAVFSGTVVSATATAPATTPGATPSGAPTGGVGAASQTITHQVAAESVYKGRIAAPEQVVTTTPRTRTDCGLGQLGTARRYLFFVESSGTANAPTWFDDGCSGTQLTTAALEQQVAGVLGAPEPATPPPPPPAAVLTDVDTSEPPSLGRAVAPGLALVIIGLLGLMVVRRLGSRR